MSGTLSDALLLRVDHQARSELEAVADLERILQRLVSVAAAEWPGLELQPEVFVAYLADRLDPGAGLDAIERVRSADLYLAAACAYEVPGAIERFDETFGPEVAKAIGHMDKTSTLVDDVTQALRTKLFTAEPGERGKIADFSGKSRLWRWLRVIATRLAIDFSAPDRLAGRLADSSLPDNTGDLELEHFRRHSAGEFRAAFAEAVAALPPDERTLLKLHLIDRLSIDQLGSLRSVHRATAARWLQRARDRLATLTLERLRERLGIESAEVDSVMRLIRSQLDVSIARLLDP